MSKKIEIIHPSGEKKSYPWGISGSRLAQTLGHGHAKKVLALSIDDHIQELYQPIVRSGRIQFFTFEDEIGKKIFWHSSAHLLAEALKALFPRCQLGIGPPIRSGFYYDVDFGKIDFDASHLPLVEKKMIELAREKNPFFRMNVSRKAAEAFFKKNINPYKLEILSGLDQESITFYRHGDHFVDLCKGHHIPHTGLIKAIKLTGISGAYFKGDQKRNQLTRIYGVSFPKVSLLEEHLEKVKAAEARDHRKIGQALGLFTFSQEVGIGLPLWLPKGAFIREKLIAFMRKKQVDRGYKSVSTPHIGGKALYVRSGHYQKYKNDTFQPIQTPHEGEEFLLKPMNCPHHCAIFSATPKSYKNLPIRLAEFGTVYRYEQHGELHGLTRTRGFTQDDAHIFCRPDQVAQEVGDVLDLVLEVFKAFDFSAYRVQLSLRSEEKKEQYIGSQEAWERAETALKEIVANRPFQTTIAKGEAAFYGPKIDFIVEDALGRAWQMGTVQIDYQLPERFNLTYSGKENQKERPVMIHRAPFGSLERFIAILIEHTEGKFPLWLAPTQIRLLPISSRHIETAKIWEKKLKQANIRAEIDERNEKINRKIRDAEAEKIPYMGIIGDKESEKGTLALRKQSKGNQGEFSAVELIERLVEEIEK